MTGDRRYEWWQRGVIYQIYPRSFADSNGDGVGDLNGFTGRLDYLAWLGVDAVWLSPICPSPMADFGYDISDYTGVDPLFGTLADFDRLVAEAHGRGLKLILDFVPNHSSDRHAWFAESRSSRTNPKRDWYIWRDPKPDGGPPNNWLSNFGGSAWTFDETTGQYYYHAFLKEQPDLNWRNPALRAAMHGTLRFWLDRGVDGFRVDVIWHMIKDDQFRDNPRDESFTPGDNPYHEFQETYTTDRPEVHEIIAGMRAVLDEYPERMMVGEIYLPIDRLATYYGEGGRGAHLPFNFQLVTLPWDAETIATAVDDYEAALPTYGWPNWVLGNHDRPRIASRAGDAQARVAAMLLLTLRGTPTMYYGDELGMTDVPIPPELVHDPLEKNVPGLGLGRDPIRTPMPWDAGKNAGFSIAAPWLPLHADAAVRNVAVERDDPGSILSLYRQLLALRRASPALEIGTYARAPAIAGTFAYRRQHWDEHFLIALNFTGEPQTIAIESGGRIVLSSRLDRCGETVAGTLVLRPDEGVIVQTD